MNTPKDKSSEIHLEDLSAFMDGEMAAQSSVFFASRMSHESELGNKWSRYHLIRDVICKQEALLAGSKFCDCVRQGYQMPEQELVEQPTNRWLKPVIGMAMTAAVAFVAVTSVVQLPGDPASSALDEPTLVLATKEESKNFVTPEIPVLTSAANATVPVSMSADSPASTMYPRVNQVNGSANLAEYLFRQQAKADSSRPVFILRQPGQRASIIFIAPSSSSKSTAPGPQLP